jgi:tight adherence protein C
MSILNGFMGMLTDSFGPMGPFYALGLLGFLLILGILPFLLMAPKDPFKKLEKHDEKKAKKSEPDRPSLRHVSKGPNLDKYKTFLEPQDQENFSKARLKLVQAGYRDKAAVRTYHFAQMSLALGGLFLGILYTVMTSADATTQSMLVGIVVPAGAGYYAPSYWVTRRSQTRITAMTEGFPDALDLMLVCVEAGQSLDQSIQRVAQEIRPGFPELSEEFEIVAVEMRAGKDRVTVLRDMAERVGAPDISAFVTVLIQSASFGTSISEALRVYANEMRDKRVMRAEEKANVLPTKLTLGTMMFTLPPLMIILIGPSIYDIYLTLAAGK